MTRSIPDPIVLPPLGSVEERSLQSANGDEAAINRLFMTSWWTMPPRRGSRQVLRAYSTMPRLRSVVSLIAEMTAASQPRVYKAAGRRGRQAKQETKDIERRKALTAEATRSGDLVEAPDHLLAKMLRQPNPELGSVATRRLQQVYLDLVGESFDMLETDAFGQPIEMWPVPSIWVQEVPSSRLETTGEPYFQIAWMRQPIRLPRERVLWMRDLDVENPYARGVGIAFALGDELDTDEFAAKWLKAFFANFATPRYLIGVEGAGPEALKVSSTEWQERNRQQPGRIHFHNGRLNAIRLQDSFAEAQLIELRKFEADFVRQTYHVSPELIGDVENSNRATAQAAMEAVARVVIAPRLELRRSEYQERLVPLYLDGDDLLVEFDDPMPPDEEARRDSAKAVPQALRVNEWRRRAGEAAIEGMDDAYVNPVTGQIVNLAAPNPIDLDLNDLTLALERAVRAGDLGLANQIRAATSLRLGAKPLPDLTVEEIAELNAATKPAPAPPDPANPPPAPGTKALPRRTKATDDELDEVIESISPVEIEELATPIMRKIVAAFGDDLAKEVGASFAMLDPRVVDHLAQFSGERISMINETTREAVRAELIQGVALGEGIGPLSSRIRKVMDLAKGYRAENIARTEVVRSANFARLEAMSQSGVVDGKGWLTTIDGRQRSSHSAMNGQQRALDEPFTSPSGATAQHPGAFGIPSEDCSCRCAVTPVIMDPDEEKSWPLTPEQEEVQWRAFDRLAASWEGTLRDAMVQAFDRQEIAAVHAARVLA